MRSLAKKPIWGHTKRLKHVLHVVRCAKQAPQRPKNNANPSGLLEKVFIVYEACYFVGKVEISLLRGVGWVPEKRAHFGATAPA